MGEHAIAEEKDLLLHPMPVNGVLNALGVAVAGSNCGRIIEQATDAAPEAVVWY